MDLCLLALVLNPCPNAPFPPLWEFLDAQSLGKIQLSGNKELSRGALAKLAKHRAEFFESQGEDGRGRIRKCAFKIDRCLLVTLQVQDRESGVQIKCLNSRAFINKENIQMHDKMGRLVMYPEPKDSHIDISIVGKTIRIAGHEFERPHVT